MTHSENSQLRRHSLLVPFHQSVSYPIEQVGVKQVPDITNPIVGYFLDMRCAERTINKLDGVINQRDIKRLYIHESPESHVYTPLSINLTTEHTEHVHLTHLSCSVDGEIAKFSLVNYPRFGDFCSQSRTSIGVVPVELDKSAEHLLLSFLEIEYTITPK